MTRDELFETPDYRDPDFGAAPRDFFVIARIGLGFRMRYTDGSEGPAQGFVVTDLASQKILGMYPLDRAVPILAATDIIPMLSTAIASVGRPHKGWLVSYSVWWSVQDFLDEKDAELRDRGQQFKEAGLRFYRMPLAEKIALEQWFADQAVTCTFNEEWLYGRPVMTAELSEKSFGPPRTDGPRITDLEIHSMQMDIGCGLPHVTDEMLASMNIYDGLSPLEQHRKFWEQNDAIGFPMARGLLVLPFGPSHGPDSIHGRHGQADLESPEAEEAINVFGAMVRPELLAAEGNRHTARQCAQYECARTRLVKGAVALVIPLRSSDIADWAFRESMESFVRSRTPLWIGLTAIQENGRLTQLNRLKVEFFDLEKFSVPPSALTEKRCGIFFTGHAPSLSEPIDADAMRRATRMQVPYAMDAPGPVAAPSPGSRNALRKDPTKSLAPLGATSFMNSCPRARRREWETEMPDVWAKLYNRRYADITGFMHAKTIARCNASILFPSKWPDGTSPQALTAQSAIPRLMRFFNPLYFVAQPMVEAILKTKFPEDLKPREVPLPVPAMTLVLPESQKGVMGSDGTPVHYIIITRTSIAEQDADLSEALTLLDPQATASEMEKFIREQVPGERHDQLEIAGISSSGAQIFELSVSWDMDKIVTEAALLEQYKDHPNFAAAAAFRLVQFVFNTLLYFNAVPQYLEPSRINNSVRTKTSHAPKASIDYWLPHFYGRSFSMPSEPGDERPRQGRQPRPHLRWAHWRRQWHGPGMTLLKWIRIDFTWVYPSDTDSEEPQ